MFLCLCLQTAANTTTPSGSNETGTASHMVFSLGAMMASAVATIIV